MSEQRVQVSNANLLKKLSDLITHIGTRLQFNKFPIGEYIPQIAVLMEINKQVEPIRSRILAELRDTVFNISTSKPIRVMWDKRFYYCGAAAKGFSLAPALKIIQFCENYNRTLIMEAMRAGTTTVIEKSIMIYWDTFKLDDGKMADQNTSSEIICKTELYRMLNKMWDDRKLLENRQPQMRDNIDTMFKAAPGTPYEALSGDVMAGFSPRGGATMPSATINNAFKMPGSMPPPPPPLPPNVVGDVPSNNLGSGPVGSGPLPPPVPVGAGVKV